METGGLGQNDKRAGWRLEDGQKMTKGRVETAGLGKMKAGANDKGQGGDWRSGAK